MDAVGKSIELVANRAGKQQVDRCEILRHDLMQFVQQRDDAGHIEPMGNANEPEYDLLRMEIITDPAPVGWPCRCIGMRLVGQIYNLGRVKRTGKITGLRQADRDANIGAPKTEEFIAFAYPE